MTALAIINAALWVVVFVDAYQDWHQAQAHKQAAFDAWWAEEQASWLTLREEV